MIAAFGNLNVSGVPRRGDHARSQIVIQKRRRLGWKLPQIPADRFQDALHFAGAHDGVHFRNLLQNLRPVTLHQAARHD